ncbi:hypothetical protein DBV05_g5758 [Lasiodiplodia theobromae]|uniref:Uncharacterized protein n=1 Tax=Lasiodiplodia theobromae TaxID=45133 RepID=A0A5N5DD24_9PEZI|nr:hypothetical protein DBV05_g5758 [Lasiodiplodia theobromae]
MPPPPLPTTTTPPPPSQPRLRTPSPPPSTWTDDEAEANSIHHDYHLAPTSLHPAPPSPAFTSSTIYRTPDEAYSDAETDLTEGSGIATPVTLSSGRDGERGGSSRDDRSLRYEDLPPSYEEAQQQHHQQQQQGNPLSPPPSFAETAAGGPFYTVNTNISPAAAGPGGLDPLLPAVERLVLREKERAASENENGSETRSAWSGSGSGGAAREGRPQYSFAAVEGLASEHHGVLEVALQWAHPAWCDGDRKEPVSTAPLGRPVALPQRSGANSSSNGERKDGNGEETTTADVPSPDDVLAFARAYAPALQDHGVPPPLFVAFLDGLNAVCQAARAPASLSSETDDDDGTDLELVETYLARANALFFAHRGLLARVVDIDGLLDDVLRLSNRANVRGALAADVTREGLTERERVDALDPWVETRLVWDGLPESIIGLWDLRGQQREREGERGISGQQQQQQQRRKESLGGLTAEAEAVIAEATAMARAAAAGLPPSTTAAPNFAAVTPPRPTLAATTTTPAYASGEFYQSPEGGASGLLLDEKEAQARQQAWAYASSSSSQQQQQYPQPGPSNNRSHIFPPLPPITPLPAFGPFPPAPPPPFGDHARWADWGQGLGRRWADWGQRFGANWAAWGQDVGNRAAMWGQEVGRGVDGRVDGRGFGGGGVGGGWGAGGGWGGGGRGHWGGGGGCGRIGRGAWGGGAAGFAGAGPSGGQGGSAVPGFAGPYGHLFGGPRGFGFAGRGGGRWAGRGRGGAAGHELRRGWGSSGAGPFGQYGTFGVPAHHGVGDDVPNQSTTTLNTRISLEDNDDDSSSSSSSSDSDSEVDEIEFSYLKRMRSIEESASDALAKGKRSQTEVERDRSKAIEKARADRDKAERKLEARRKKEEGRREMKAKRKEWREHRSAARESGREGKKERKAEKKRLKKEYKDARNKWKEGRREERRERKNEKRERRDRRRGDGGGRCGVRVEGDLNAQGGRSLEVGVVPSQDEDARAVPGAAIGASSAPTPSSSPPQLLWVVVENLGN